MDNKTVQKLIKDIYDYHARDLCGVWDTEQLHDITKDLLALDRLSVLVTHWFDMSEEERKGE